MPKDWKEEHDDVLKQLKAIKRKYDIQKTYSEKVEKRLNILEKQLKRYKEEKVKQKDKARKELMKEREIQARDILIQQMQFELKKQKDLTNLYNEQIKKDQEFNTIISTGKLPVIVIDRFTNDSITNAHREFNIKEKIVFFKEYKHSLPTLKTLVTFKPKILLNPVDRQHLIELKRKRIINLDMKPDIHQFYGSIELTLLQNSISSAERKDFDNWLAFYKSR